MYEEGILRGPGQIVTVISKNLDKIIIKSDYSTITYPKIITYYKYISIKKKFLEKIKDSIVCCSVTKKCINVKNTNNPYCTVFQIILNSEWFFMSNYVYRNRAVGNLI